MITKNFKSLLACVLQSSAAIHRGLVPGVTTDGSSVYMGNVFNSFDRTVRFSNTSGIWIGSGSTAATEDDYTLESQLTSGLSASSVLANQRADNDGNPYVEYAFSLANQSASEIVVKEIGFVQAAYAANEINDSAGRRFFLLDRTVLNSPVIIPVDAVVNIKYTLKTILHANAPT